MIYVDPLRETQPKNEWPYKYASHMISDESKAELVSFAEGIGLNPLWIRASGTPEEHFDITEKVRERAIGEGAKAVSSREFVGIIRTKRERERQRMKEQAQGLPPHMNFLADMPFLAPLAAETRHQKLARKIRKFNRTGKK